MGYGEPPGAQRPGGEPDAGLRLAALVIGAIGTLDGVVRCAIGGGIL